MTMLYRQARHDLLVESRFVSGQLIASKTSSIRSKKPIRGANESRRAPRGAGHAGRSVKTLWRFRSAWISAGLRRLPRQPASPWRERERLPGRRTCRMKACPPNATFQLIVHSADAACSADFPEQRHPRRRWFVDRRLATDPELASVLRATLEQELRPNCSNGSGRATWACNGDLRDRTVSNLHAPVGHSDGSHTSTMSG